MRASFPNVILAAVALLPTGCVLLDRVDDSAYKPCLTCEVHHTPLLPDVVPVRFGMEIYGPDDVEVDRSCFPNANASVGGGCCMPPMKRGALVRYCPECRKAEEAWENSAEYREMEAHSHALRFPPE